MKDKYYSILMILMQFVVTLPLYLALEVITLRGSAIDNFSIFHLLAVVIIGLIMGILGGHKTKKWWLPIVVSLSSGFLIVILGMILTMIFSYRPENRAAILFAFLVAMIQVIYILAIIISSLLVLAIDKWQKSTHHRTKS
ncbi:MAG: hypothetical protein ACM3ZC_14945 [Bacteroidota bacterium]